MFYSLPVSPTHCPPVLPCKKLRIGGPAATVLQANPPWLKLTYRARFHNGLECSG